MKPIVALCMASSVEDASSSPGSWSASLAACVNIVPGVTSIYRWRGRGGAQREVQLVIKTSAERFEALREAIVKLHTYELPGADRPRGEASHAPYLAWLEESLG
jgi:periplasmic divalent cation tolerance protein